MKKEIFMCHFTKLSDSHININTYSIVIKSKCSAETWTRWKCMCSSSNMQEFIRKLQSRMSPSKCL